MHLNTVTAKVATNSIMITNIQNLNDDLHFWATLTTCVCGRSRTFVPFIVRRISPTESPDDWAGVPGSIAETTTGREP